MKQLVKNDFQNKNTDDLKTCTNKFYCCLCKTKYIDRVKHTDKLSKKDLRPVLFGLFGEVGEIMSTTKKYHREKKAFARHKRAVREEFGDALWYFTTLCRRIGLSIEDIFSDKNFGVGVKRNRYLNGALVDLGKATASLMQISPKMKMVKDEDKKLLRQFAGYFLQALQFSGISPARMVLFNLKKVESRFLDLSCKSKLPTFDNNFDSVERLPDKFKIKIIERANKQIYLQWNNVVIGDLLTDNSCNSDGYRFHDVFHFAYAAILHWSPVTRALIKHKRKSDPAIDEVQDGGRAIVVEEGLTAWVFSRAKELDFYEGQESVSFDTLKTIGEFVRGYEVAKCPLKLWEKAIIEGYKVFRKVRDNEGGIIIGNRKERTIRYKSL